MREEAVANHLENFGLMCQHRVGDVLHGVGREIR
jgi:hypothetical protein